MKNYSFFIILLFLCSAFINGVKKSNSPFNQLFVLEGNWIMKTKKGIICEEWKKINNDYLQNRGYRIRGNDTITTERVALRNTADGIFYTSTVEDQNNQQPISFKLSSAGNNLFIFENPQHDFPKRITYNLITKDSLRAWIEDGKDIPEKKMLFQYSRQK